MFKKKAAGTQFVAPHGVNATPQRLIRSVPFAYVGDGSPAVSLSKDYRAKHVSLSKSYDAMAAALEAAGLAGLRCEIMVMLDDSGSIRNQWGSLLEILVRYLGAALNLSASGRIMVFTYGRPNHPIVITRDNYQNIAKLVTPTWGYTPMGETLAHVVREAEKINGLVIICNATDGNPYTGSGDATAKMTNEVIKASGGPYLLKNVAVADVPYLDELDDLPSQIEIEKDGGGNPLKDAAGNLILWRNPQGIRLFDNVDSQDFPNLARMTDEEFAKRFAEEIPEAIEVMAHAGILTGVPGHDRTFF